jgi:hypothetical protein
MERNTMTPSALRSAWEWQSDVDISAVLPTIKVPTLLLNRRDSFWAQQMRDMAAAIPSVEHVEFSGSDHFPMGHDDDDSVVEAIGTFITGERPADTCSDRYLATVLFTDLVASSQRAAEIGDRRWRELLDAHDQLIARQAKRFRGTTAKPTGDGALLSFDGPSRAIDCALAITDGMHDLGLEARAGIHTGEVEQRADGDLAGVAVSHRRPSTDQPQPLATSWSHAPSRILSSTPHTTSPPPVYTGCEGCRATGCSLTSTTKPAHGWVQVAVEGFRCGCTPDGDGDVSVHRYRGLDPTTFAMWWDKLAGIDSTKRCSSGVSGIAP